MATGGSRNFGVGRTGVQAKLQLESRSNAALAGKAHIQRSICAGEFGGEPQRTGEDGCLTIWLLLVLWP